MTILQSECGPDMEGLSCEYGSTFCCGETFPELVLTCMGGTWEGYYIDTPCILFPGHNYKMTTHNESTRLAVIGTSSEPTLTIDVFPMISRTSLSNFPHFGFGFHAIWT